MSTLYRLNICLSNIPKEAIKVASDGKAYINADLWINDSLDNYGNLGSLSITQTKEQRERKDKKTYIGNVKDFNPKTPTEWDQHLAK